MHQLWPSLCYLPRGVHLWEWSRGGTLDQETAFVVKSIRNVSCLGPAIVFCIEKCLRVMVMAALSYISVCSPVDNLKLSNIELASPHKHMFWLNRTGCRWTSVFFRSPHPRLGDSDCKTWFRNPGTRDLWGFLPVLTFHIPWSTEGHIRSK